MNVSVNAYQHLFFSPTGNAVCVPTNTTVYQHTFSVQLETLFLCVREAHVPNAYQHTYTLQSNDHELVIMTKRQLAEIINKASDEMCVHICVRVCMSSCACACVCVCVYAIACACECAYPCACACE